MKAILLIMVAALSYVGAPKLFAHDEGHGPKLTDQGKRGGVMSPVIDKKDYSKGAKAAVVYKGELVMSEDGTVRVYLYDVGMNPLDAVNLSAKAKGVVETEKKGKMTRVPFPLNLEEDGGFMGVAPKSKVKPFNIDVVIKEGERDLLVAFDNLD